MWQSEWNVNWRANLYFFRNILAIAELAPFFSNVITSSRILGPVEWGHRTMGTCLMNPNWNFYVPIPGPKKFGEDETQKANWAVERLEAVHCFLDELAQKYLASYTDIWEYCWTQNLFLCIWEYPSKLCYTLCSKKTSKYPEQNMLTKPQICCGCCAYPVQFVPWL